MDKLPVIFRAERAGDFKGEVTAVFPTIPADYHGGILCYSHVGQHGGCSDAWHRSTRPATVEEYAPLLAELRGIYEQGEDAVTLQVCPRRTRWHRAVYLKEVRRLANA